MRLETLTETLSKLVPSGEKTSVIAMSHSRISAREHNLKCFSFIAYLEFMQQHLPMQLALSTLEYRGCFLVCWSSRESATATDSALMKLISFQRTFFYIFWNFDSVGCERVSSWEQYFSSAKASLALVQSAVTSRRKIWMPWLAVRWMSWCLFIAVTSRRMICRHSPFFNEVSHKSI